MTEPSVTYGKSEAADWEVTRNQHTLKAYHRFLTTWPGSRFAEEANLHRLELQEGRDWQQAQRIDKVFAYEQFLDAYPAGVFRDEALYRLEQLRDRLKWEEACARHSVAAYLEYKRAYAKGAHVKEATQRIVALLKTQSGADLTTTAGRTGHQEEDQALEQATAEDTLLGYNLFLEKYPDSRYKQQVEIRIRQLLRLQKRRESEAEEEQQAWIAAERQHTMLAYSDFLRMYPDGLYADTARERLTALEKKFTQRIWSDTSSPAIHHQEPEPPAPIRPEDRHQQAFNLALIWSLGFGSLSVVSYLLEPFLYVLCLITALVVGIYFAANRLGYIHLRESIVYAGGIGILIGLLLFHISQTLLAHRFPSLIAGLVVGGIIGIWSLRWLQNTRTARTQAEHTKQEPS
ncbi:MAG: hypothetical protein SF053_00160 [Bacteroidia bacterium]|nr:hypothetical protein [Bacteroidia bacterium]